MRPSVPAVNAVALKNQGLMSLFLRPHEPHWGTKHIWGTVHRAAALVIEAEDGGNHIAAAFRSFQCWGALRLITDPSGCGALSRQETSGKKKPSWIAPTAAVRPGNRWGDAVWSKNTCPLSVPRRQAISMKRRPTRCFFAW